MKYTVEFPLSAVSDADDVDTIARAVDRLGYDALAFTEHPAPSQAWLDSAVGHLTFDLLGSLAYCAAITERVRLMSFLVVLPYHRPFMLAKALSTIDVLSRGRLTAVVGAGYLRAEFDALGVPFDERNALLDETLALLPEIWSGEPVTRSGSGFTAADIVSRPAPVQPGGPPLWIGGNGPRAKERAARTGGWSPLFIGGDRASSIGTTALTDADQLAAGIREVRNRARVLRGEDAEVVVQALTPHSRVMFAEHSVAEHRDLVASLAEIGVDWFVIRAPGHDAAAVVDALEYYAGELRL
ncbi:TIGR03619 family F420-dependent LLM class oxidoreductase [Agromyces aerolatus]|uniref:TIGR03619 family F420-dependent LLM class oxidoreductase n=1 Tax=Agromyces sp. LY-1074 TaxID=3074080 RepID=UPI002857571C|nr:MULTISPECIES: TIGR03619 family F420-dependent LLM class oxidoreductase [unclassified Agromyces]MDR5699120.1 TIGR03619 family F420-dependent LLM class oxidoreductase [Agromyces sp. LY-1074]MDR5705101.1 TIGR03619 family F420-dependent LLM class oxidoreductase [Agromyces sp. LY-1358]